MPPDRSRSHVCWYPDRLMSAQSLDKDSGFNTRTGTDRLLFPKKKTPAAVGAVNGSTNPVSHTTAGHMISQTHTRTHTVLYACTSCGMHSCFTETHSSPLKAISCPVLLHFVFLYLGRHCIGAIWSWSGTVRCYRPAQGYLGTWQQCKSTPSSCGTTFLTSCNLTQILRPGVRQINLWADVWRWDNKSTCADGDGRIKSAKNTSLTYRNDKSTSGDCSTQMIASFQRNYVILKVYT